MKTDYIILFYEQDNVLYINDLKKTTQKKILSAFTTGRV